jgi:hypothetical protein
MFWRSALQDDRPELLLAQMEPWLQQLPAQPAAPAAVASAAE